MGPFKIRYYPDGITKEISRQEKVWAVRSGPLYEVQEWSETYNKFMPLALHNTVDEIPSFVLRIYNKQDILQSYC